MPFARLMAYLRCSNTKKIHYPAAPKGDRAGESACNIQSSGGDHLNLPRRGLALKSIPTRLQPQSQLRNSGRRDAKLLGRTGGFAIGQRQGNLSAPARFVVGLLQAVCLFWLY